jgi:PKHD-type hydroxylase
MMEGFQFTRYDAPTGHYGMHVDKALNGQVRKLSLTIQLSSPDDYEGGELALQYDLKPEVMSKELGKMIVFPIPSALGAFTGYKLSYLLIQLLSN